MWLSANFNWWQAQPQIKEILFVFENTSSAVVESYEFAQVDAVFTRSIAGAQHKNSANSITMSYRTNQLECLYMNNNARELSLEVRQAIRCLIDKSKIISTAYMGLAVPTNFPYYPGTWMYNDSLDASITHDVEQAKRLLAESGWEDSDENGILDRINGNGELENLHLRLFYYEEPDNDVREETANIISSALAEVGRSGDSDFGQVVDGDSDGLVVRCGAGGVVDGQRGGGRHGVFAALFGGDVVEGNALLVGSEAVRAAPAAGDLAGGCACQRGIQGDVVARTNRLSGDVGQGDGRDVAFRVTLSPAQTVCPAMSAKVTAGMLTVTLAMAVLEQCVAGSVTVRV